MNEVSPLIADVDFAHDPVPDLYERLTKMRRAGHRVATARFGGETAWIILGYDELADALMDNERLPAAPAYERHTVPSVGRVLMAMERDEHRANRSLVAGGFMPASVRQRTMTLLYPLANSLIDEFGSVHELELVGAFCHPFPFQVMSRLLGIPRDDDERILAILHKLFRYMWEPEVALAAKDEMDALLNPLIEARRATPGDDLISLLTQARFEGRQLGDEEVRAFVRLLYPAGAETTYLTMGSMIWAILREEDLYQTLLQQPELRAAAVEEALRMYGSVAVNPRFTERAVTLGGIDIPAQSWILYAHSSANYDEAVFSEPHRFRLDRFKGTSNVRHLTFGRGEHACLGLNLARAELLTALNLLLDRLPGLKLQDPGAAGPTLAIQRGVRKLHVRFGDVRAAATS